MPALFACPKCASVLRVPDSLRGRLVRCPKCRVAVRVPAAEPAAPAKEAQERITERLRAGIARRRLESDELDPPTRRRRPEDRPRREVVEEAPEDVEEVVELELAEEPEEPPPERPKKKKKRKKKRLLLPVAGEEEEREGAPAWVWWAGGGGGIVLTMLTLLIVAILAKSESRLKYDAAYMFVAMPISTMIFFVAMILCNVIVGECDIGQIHIAIVKIFVLLIGVNAVKLVHPVFGPFLTAPIWPLVMMVIFRFDFFEAFLLSFFNWVLNYVIDLILFACLSAWILHGGGAGVNFGIGPPEPPPQKEGWDATDVEKRGGQVEYDPDDEEHTEVIGISFRGASIRDADLEHMKDFPLLRKLDLTNTRITDLGLMKLARCWSLQSLTLTGTDVTRATTDWLREQLPGVKIVR